MQEGNENLFWEPGFVGGRRWGGGVIWGRGQGVEMPLRSMVIKEESSGLGCG